MIAIAVGYLIFLPQYNEAQVIREETASVLGTVRERQAFLQSVERNLATLVAQPVQEQELNLVLPEHNHSDEVLRIIDRAATAAGVRVDRIINQNASVAASRRASAARGEATVQESVVPLGVTMSATGSYQQFKFFVDQLDSSIRLLDVTSAVLSIPDQGSPEALSIEMVVQYYSYSDGK